MCYAQVSCSIVDAGCILNFSTVQHKLLWFSDQQERYYILHSQFLHYVIISLKHKYVYNPIIK